MLLLKHITNCLVFANRRMKIVGLNLLQMKPATNCKRFRELCVSTWYTQEGTNLRILGCYSHIMSVTWTTLMRTAFENMILLLHQWRSSSKSVVYGRINIMTDKKAEVYSVLLKHMKQLYTLKLLWTVHVL